ncbi:ADAMTS-like protein 2 [Ditylenchus destructor]|nr:ADAMTS-like protein 2 [Ditylenchus destructor]
MGTTKPEFEKPCQTVDCEAEWYIGEWEQRSQTCGDGGWQYRVVYCHKVFADGRRMTVSDGNCSAVERPEVKQTCSRFACPEWQAGPWSACSEKCGDARQYRSVTCRSQKEGEEAKLLPAESCDTEGKVENERNCNLGPCEGLNFVTSEWNLCLRCNDTEETRNVTCKDKTGRAYPLEKCLNETIAKIPDDTRTCATQAPCIYEWHSSQWSKCSTECGHGHKTRNAHCAINEMGEITIADESLCSGEKPCNGGNQSRVVVCLNYDRKPVPEWCDEKEKPVEEQACNTDPCPTCDDSEFGCCPDNITFAQGSFLEGCTNCSISDFGCCEDNVTEATGPNGKGCLEYIGSEEGSGEETIETTPSEEETKCEVTDEKTGEAIQVPCSVTIPPQTVEDILGGEDENGTMGQNITKHCSKTEFGCCPDWYTPAESTDYAGCPEFTLGACNETKHGCCPDNVTLARGPNLEGCGEPSCAASHFGCCKDGKTIAFGSHYAGCERSSFPCELSTYGCCPDGETAALGKNMTGCGANCLVTKYGCCPDGVTTAKGTSNEGCGCEFAQYGCCPDGKSAAKGAGYYGCPDTCAQSQCGCCPDGKTPSRGPNKEG